MKKIIFALTATCFLVLACDKIDSLLDTTNYQKADTSNFPKTEKDAVQIVNSIYSSMTKYYMDPKRQPVWRNLVAGDENLGGGNTETQGIDRLLEDDSSNFEDCWASRYKTIFRSNFAIESISQLDDDVFSSPEYKNYLLGQAYFLRAWTNWELAELFETFPLLTSTEPVNIPRSSVDEIYESIASDFETAISLMSAKYDYTPGNSETTARATRYAAEAALARVFLFYTGFYGKDSMFGVTKDKVVNYLKDIVNNSNFGLVDDPREIWSWTNEYSSGFAYGTDFNTYASQNNLRWVGNLCKESIWVTHFSLVGDYNDGYNRLSDYTGLRGGSGKKNPDAESYPYGKGYYARSVNPNMVKDWLTDPDYGARDIRLWGSLFATGDIDQRLDWMNGQYVELPAFSMMTVKDDQSEDSHFRVKKYMPVVAYDGAAKKNLYKIWYYVTQLVRNEVKTADRSDVIHIRYADVLLMLDELQGTVNGMNRLRQRAGLEPYSGYTFERLQKERRYELAFEGFRFMDLRRWYPKDAGRIISNNQEGVYIEHRGNVIEKGWQNVPGNSIEKRYNETRGFWMIPTSEIILSDGVLEQTPGWTADYDYIWSKERLPY
ncbi:MAG: RagB/SusD family nutrient uptake outer membrane protein [Bacteroidales bacterium]|nr:RagB/SusD family nutrient uptake outer membrane protein [Bacteroidales bacterium]